MSIKKTFLHHFEALIDPMPMILAPSNGPRPGTVFATIQVTPGQTLPAHQGRVDQQGVRKLFGPRVVQVQIQCYGSGSWDVLDALAMNLSTQAALESSEAANISILSVERLQSVPALMDNQKYEDRAILDLTAHYIAAIDEDVGFIETVEGSGQVNALPPVPFSATVV